ncbi:proton-conducting transporter membrane subunit [Desulfuromonas sp. TF]|uniref:proton-conducting transporter transmembrane domain-containing protein n=1 Tax=Desulfuromonas sp. TF TaxID=1232410 RepID=UPI000482DE98|nr:proton-conducting transporter membrane subunit [Desulfuromonas sp. TF]
MIAALIILPLLLAAVALAVPSGWVRPWLLPLGGGCHLLLSFRLIATGDGAIGSWLAADPLGGLVLGVSSLLFFGCSIYAVGYLRYRMDRGNRVIVPCLLLFLSAVTLATLARHLGLLWLAVETTTLTSAPLIYYNRNRLSIEATWKYLLICSVGIALAMLGILFIAYAALHGGVPVSLQLDDLLARAGTFSRPWLHAGFVFLLVGFGTKMGLAPLHSWKPDAYGEAPGLVGALLAGGLTSVAFLAILRGMQIMAAAGDLALARQAMLCLGLLSLALAAVFMVRQPDIKRLLAYSSVEHMGILAIGVGIGGVATFGAMFHLLNNALTKGVLFLSAGNIQRAYSSKRLGEVQGAMARVPVSAGLFLAGFFAITGSPPFGPFLSEFTILRGIFDGGHGVIGGLFLFLLAVVFIGMGGTVLSVTQGAEPEGLPDSGYRESLLTVGPPLVFILLILLLGLSLPEALRTFLQEAADVLEVTP